MTFTGHRLFGMTMNDPSSIIPTNRDDLMAGPWGWWEFLLHLALATHHSLDRSSDPNLAVWQISTKWEWQKFSKSFRWSWNSEKYDKMMTNFQSPSRWTVASWKHKAWTSDMICKVLPWQRWVWWIFNKLMAEAILSVELTYWSKQVFGWELKAHFSNPGSGRQSVGQEVSSIFWGMDQMTLDPTHGSKIQC